MAVHGFVTHAVANRRKLRWMVASYIAAFQVISAFALIVLLAIHDPGNTIITNPPGYAIRYVIPVGILAYLLFRLFYHGHLKHVQKKLDVKIVRPDAANNAEEQRLLRVADPVCIASGLRLPQFAIINASEPNALAVGATRDCGLIAVTRGLLHQLDDEELAAVIAHEAAHIRNGDTQIMAANHALMRTAVNLQVNNPMRLESWQPFVLAVALPFLLPLLLAGNAATMLAMRLSFQAKKGIADSRDFIADAEAVRITQFPDALISALRKVGDDGAFRGSEHFSLMLFAGGKPAEGETLPTVKERVQNIEALSGAMLEPARVRRDTRGDAASIASAPRAASFGSALRKRELTPPPPMPTLLEILTRPRCWIEWHEHTVDYHQWRENDERNAIGLKPKMLLPLALTLTFLLIFHWPTHGTFLGAIQIFNPANLVAGWETAEGGLSFFKYASEEAAKKQGYLTFLIMAGFIIATIIPGVREVVYPHVDWKNKGKWQGFGAGAPREPERAMPVFADPASPDPRERAVARHFGISAAAPAAAVATRAMPEPTNKDDAMSSEKDEEENQPWHRRMIDEAKDMAVESVIDEVVGTLSGGWLSYERDDDEDDRRPAKQQAAKRETFEERLERELAQLPKDGQRDAEDGGLPASVSTAFDQSVERELARLAAEQQAQSATSAPQQAPAPAPYRPVASPMGFGRKVA